MADLPNAHDAIEGVLVSKDRRWDILARLLKYGKVVTSDLATELNANERTIRRYLAEIPGLLHEIKLVVEYVEERGGARLMKREESYYDIQMTHRVAEKRTIAELIVNGGGKGKDKQPPLIEKDEALFMGMGSSVKFVAEELRRKGPYVVMTNSLGVMNELMHSKSIVWCSGGRIAPHLGGFVGDRAAAAIEEFKARKIVVGTSGVSFESGDVTFHDELQGSVHRAAIENCKVLIVVADSTKLRRLDPWVFGNMQQLVEEKKTVMIVTSADIDKKEREQFETYKGKLASSDQDRLHLIIAGNNNS